MVPVLFWAGVRARLWTFCAEFDSYGHLDQPGNGAAVDSVNEKSLRKAAEFGNALAFGRSRIR